MNRIKLLVGLFVILSIAPSCRKTKSLAARMAGVHVWTGVEYYTYYMDTDTVAITKTESITVFNANEIGIGKGIINANYGDRPYGFILSLRMTSIKR